MGFRIPTMGIANAAQNIRKAMQTPTPPMPVVPPKPAAAPGVTPRPMPRTSSPPSASGFSTPFGMSAAGAKKGGKVSSASKRADGIAQRGKTKGTMVMCGGGYMKGKK